MSDARAHATHPAIAARLKRAEGHLARVIGMIGEGRPCLDIAMQRDAVERAAERALAEARRALIHDHIDHCLTAAPESLAEVRALARLL
jgi:DNA-binding FrmR family transcriptional regulator